jgi:hypothetical protein
MTDTSAKYKRGIALYLNRTFSVRLNFVTIVLISKQMYTVDLWGCMAPMSQKSALIITVLKTPLQVIT